MCILVKTVFPDKIIRSKRRTVSLQINDRAELVVRVPNNFSSEDIQKIIDKNMEWIIRHKEEVRERISWYEPKKFVEGEEFLFLGRRYKLHLLGNLNSSPFLRSGRIIMDRDATDRRGSLIRWYMSSAQIELSRRTEYISRRTGLKYSGIKVTWAEKRWGSCSKNGQINYSWRLVMAPENVIDYVVLHELSHTVFRNHSRDFWALVRKHMPDYPSRNKWLRDNAFLLKL